MNHKNRKWVLTLACLFTLTARAQEGLDEVVVTGQRISGDDYSGIPAIVLERRADFLVQRVLLTNDTRAEDARIKELQQTIRDIVADAAKRPGMALSYGDDYLIPISNTAKEVVMIPGSKRADTSNASIYVKVALTEKDDVPAAIANLTKFIRNAKVTGRTEVEAEDEVGLSLVAPEKYRYEIIRKITDDARKLRETVGASCKVHVSGLSNRVSWQRSDVSELTLYIPYQIELTDCE
ncbi:MAG TPA: hypothetical protein VF033_06290 [Steroidobacteraceae bacterium]